MPYARHHAIFYALALVLRHEIINFLPRAQKFVQGSNGIKTVTATSQCFLSSALSPQDGDFRFVLFYFG